MLGRLILLLLQVAVGWFGTTALMNYIKFAEFRLFIFAVVAAIVVFLIGVIAALILKDVGSPSSATLTWALAFGLIAAALWTWGPQLPLLSEIPWRSIRAEYAVLAAAILGYHLKR